MAGKEPKRALLIPLGLEEESDGIRLGTLIRICVQHKFLFVALGIVIAGAVLALYLLADAKYRATTTVVISDEAGAASLGSIGAQFGGLANLAGLNLSTTGGGRVEALATLESRELVRRFISDRNLVPILFYKKWDSEKKSWDTDSGEPPSLEKAVDYFQEHVLSIDREPGSDLVELSITWGDPSVSETWANELVRLANLRLRQRAISEANKSIEFLEEEVKSSSSTELQGVIYSLIEEQMAKVMLANVRENFAFTIIDPAVAPDVDDRVSPRLTYHIAATGCLWLFICIIIVCIIAVRKNED